MGFGNATIGPRHVYHYNSCGLLHMAPLLNIFELLSVAIGSLEAITEGQLDAEGSTAGDQLPGRPPSFSVKCRR